MRLSTVQKVRLATEILRAYALVRRSMHAETLTSAVVRVRGPGRSRSRPTLLRDAADGHRLASAVTRTIRALPSGSRCLTRSLVLLDVLARRGVTGALVIAVRPTEQLGLDAHAWVEVDGRPLLAPAPDYGRLLTL